MPERRPALVHDLGLGLRIEVLRELAHDANELPLPRLELRRILLDEIEDVLLRVGREHAARLRLGLRRGLRQRPPEIVELPLAMRFALGEPRRLGLERERGGTPITIDAVRHQRVAGVEHFLDRCRAVPLLALHDESAREHEVIEDRVGGSPLAEQVIALEERVVTVAGMSDHQRLRRYRVLFHQVGDAGARIDDDLVGKTLHAAPVGLLVADEFLAVRPMRIADRESARRVGVQHLLGCDDLDLIGIRVETVVAGNARDLRVVALEQIEVPVGPARDGAH